MTDESSNGQTVEYTLGDTRQIHNLEEWLNNHARDGWRLVQVFPNTTRSLTSAEASGHQLVLERPVPPEMFAY